MDDDATFLFVLWVIFAIGFLVTLGFLMHAEAGHITHHGRDVVICEYKGGAVKDDVCIKDGKVIRKVR